MNRRKLAVFLIALFAAMTHAGTQKKATTQPFRANDYPAPNFTISQQHLEAGRAQVTVTQVRSSKGTPFMCRAWIDVHVNQLSKQVYFEDIEAVGLSYGLFVPPQQPSQNHLLISKIGDYDGKLILIRHDGSVSTIHAEGFIPDERRHLLFSTHNSRGHLKVIIYNLSADHVDFDGIVPSVKQWYGSEKWGVVFTTFSPNSNAEDTTTIYAFNTVGHALHVVDITPEDFATLKPIHYPLNESEYNDCTSPTIRRTR